MVTTFYPPYHFGGDAVYVQQLSNALAELGHDVQVVHCRDAFSITGQSPRPFPPDHTAVQVHGLHGPGTWLSPLLTHQTGRLGIKRRAVDALFREQNFDVVHFHNISLVGGLEAIELAPDAVKLLTLHDYWLVCPTHVMFRHGESACTTPQCLRCQLKHGRPPQFWRSTARIRRAVRQLDRVLAGSRFAVDLHRERGLHLPAEVLPLFSPQVRADPAAANPDGRPYYLFVGRLVKLKGIQDLLPYFKAHTEVDLLIVGEGDYEATLRELAGDAANIRFLGQRSGAQLHALYRDAVATLMPSLTYEISPMVIAESWSQATPVVVRNIGALGEIVNGSGGLCFNDSTQMGTQLNLLAADPAERDRLGRLGYSAWERDWSPKNHIERYLDLVGSLHRQRHG